ncbi:hypothetical protein FACS189475_08340 [Betaproteobacteria bacterium]|nr:hypothetical protein FACS189475_08340 [Betaproteobacteria bacterium]
MGNSVNAQGGKNAPLVIIFAGPNGSGKSTTNAEILNDPELNFKGEYINADDIAKALANEISDYRKRNIKAAEIAVQRRQTAMNENRTFAFETVMSTPEKVAIMTQAKAKNYDVALYFITTDNPEINVARVEARVAKGGHAVDPDAIRRRYHSTMDLLPCAVEHADSARIIDNSGNKSVSVAIKRSDRLTQIKPNLPEWVDEKLVKPYRDREASREKIKQSYKAECERASTSATMLTDADASHGKTYKGKIIDVTVHHALQQTGANKFVIHDRSLSIPQELQKGKQATIAYAYDKGKIVAPMQGKGSRAQKRSALRRM